MRTIWRLLQFLRPFSGWMALSVLLGVATILGAVGLMGTSAYLIAGAALHPSIAELQVAIVGVRFFGISRGVFRYLERLVSHSVNFRLLERLRVWFYMTVEPIAPAGLQEQHSGDLLSRAIADIETLENFYVRALAPPLVAAVVTLGLGFYIGQLNWGLSGILVVGLLLSGMGVPLLTRWMGRKPGREQVKARADVSISIVDGVHGIAELLVFGAERAQAARIGEAGRHLSQAQERMARISAGASVLNVLLTNLTLVAILALAIPFLRAGGMDGVTLAVLTLVTLSGFEAVLPLGSAAQHLDSSIKAGERIFEFSEIEFGPGAPIKACLPPGGVDLVIENLGFRYAPDRSWALRNFSLNLPVGKRVALVGASGSGKSSVFNLLLRFWEYQEGEIWLDGHSIRAYDPEDVRRMIGWLPQKPFLFAGTLRDNLLLAKPECKDEYLWSALNSAGLADWVAELPKKLDTWVGERGMQLSGGERQRVSIARLMLRDAPLVLLDEPEAHLDRGIALQIASDLRIATTGRSVLWISHHWTGLEGIDEVVEMKKKAD